jgi:hypothetical protein
MAIPSTRDRVPAHTAEHVNARIEREMTERVRKLSSSPTLIGRHLRHLDEEWDIERAIEANASVIAFIGVVFGYFVHPYWLALPALVTAFLFQHAIQGWCPPIPVLRRLGFRTSYEIERERHALKALRSDYRQADSADAALRAAKAR